MCSVLNILRLPLLTSVRSFALACLAALLLTGCYSDLKVKPYAETGRQPYTMVCGEVMVHGNKRYLPATVGECGNQTTPGYVIDFLHEQDYTGTTAEQELALSLMPGTMLGVPTGKDRVLVYARLRVSLGEKELALYRAACVKESYRTIYSGGVDNTGGRAECLEALKMNLEQQMLGDESFWKRQCLGTAGM